MFATPCSWHSPPPVAAPASEAPGPATHSTAALRAAHTTIPERRTSMLVPPSCRYAAPDLTDEIGVRDGQLVCQYWLSYEHGRLHPAFGGDWSPRADGSESDPRRDQARARRGMTRARVGALSTPASVACGRCGACERASRRGPGARSSARIPRSACRTP